MGKHLVLLVILISLSPLLSISQNTTARIENVSFFVEDNKIVVNYDILKFSPIEKFKTELKFIDDDGNDIIPISINGDVNKEISGGKQKVIVWDVLNDNIEITGNIKAIVNISKVSLHPGGPSNAFKSLLIPGLGDRYVNNSGNMVIKPYYKTVSAYGLIALGMVQKIKADDYYNKYLDAIKKDDIDNYYAQANKANHQFYIFTSIGATIWLADIVWVAYKGSKAGKKGMRGSYYTEYSISPNENGLSLNLCIKF